MILVTVIGATVTGSALADDLIDIRVMPDYINKQLLVDGVLGRGTARTGLGTRDRVASLLSRSVASLTMVIDLPDEQKTIKTGADSGFAFQIPVEKKYVATVTFAISGAVPLTRSWSFPAQPNRLIVSDIDDTILVSGVQQKVRLVWRSLMHSVDKRSAVAGTPALYRQLASHPNRNCLVFYLTSSPAFLSRYLHSFLQQNSFPPGILLTKRSLRGGSHENHKISWLRRLAELYPGLPMILLGDTGEKDPEIYLEFVKKFPLRAQTVILHDVAPGKRQMEVAAIQQEYVKRGVPCLVWSDAATLQRQLTDLALLKSKKRR